MVRINSRLAAKLACRLPVGAALVMGVVLLATPQPAAAGNVCGVSTDGAAPLTGLDAQAPGVGALACGSDAEANGDNSVSVGTTAGKGSAADGSIGYNTWIGYSAGSDVKTDSSGFGHNTAVGASAGQHVTGHSNTAVGSGAGFSVTGFENSAFGVSAGAAVHGYQNSAFGYEAGINVQGPGGEIVIGNSAFGALAGKDVAGQYNSAFGYEAGQLVTGNNNVAFGEKAGRFLEGSNNVAIGTGAGSGQSGVDTLVVTNTVAIGNGAVAKANDAVAIGPGAVATRNGQFVFGSEWSTYTAAGITSDISKAAQTGPLQLVTTDATGNLASDGGYFESRLSGLQSEVNALGRRDQELADGIAISLALAQPVILGNQTFATRVGWGNFDGSNAVGVTAAGVVSRGSFGPGTSVVLDAGVGVSTNESVAAGRAGVTFGW